MSAGLCGNIGGGECMTQIGVGVGRLVFGDDLAVPVCIETIEHDPIKAGELPYFPSQRLASVLRRCSLPDALDGVTDSSQQRFGAAGADPRS
jgi:hypothetical protein